MISPNEVGDASVKRRMPTIMPYNLPGDEIDNIVF